MKKWLALILIVFLMVVGTACSPEEPTQEPETPAVDEDENKVDDETPGVETEEPSVDDGQTDEPETPGKTPNEDENLVDSLKEEEIVGKDITAVKEFFGEPNLDFKDSIMHAWQYDFPVEGYSYSSDVIAVDVEGLESGEMSAQLMIYFEKDIVTSYSIYYFNGEEIMQYRETEHGSDEYSASAD